MGPRVVFQLSNNKVIIIRQKPYYLGLLQGFVSSRVSILQVYGGESYGIRNGATRKSVSYG